MNIQKIAKYKSELIDTLVRQIEIQSEKTEAIDDKPFGHGPYEALVAFLEDAKNLGFRVHNLDNYAGWVEMGPEDAPMVAALCHLDVVPAQGWSDAYQAQVLDDKIIGRGSMDDKGPAVAVLFAMKSILDEGKELPARIRLILGTDEESGSACMKYYVKHAELPQAAFTADADFPVINGEKGHCAYVLQYDGEPADFQNGTRLIECKTGTRANVIPGEATLVFESENASQKEIEYIGKMGHASMPQYAQNAIQLALTEAYKTHHNDTFLALMNKLFHMEYDGKSLGISSIDEVTGDLTLNVGIIDYAHGKGEITIDIRYPVSTSFEKITSQIEAAIADTPFSIKTSSNVDPLYISLEDPLVVTLMDAYKKVTNRDDKPLVIGGGTYARSVPNTLAFGPCFAEDENLCHQKGEYITFDTLFTAADIYREALLSLAEVYGK